MAAAGSPFRTVWFYNSVSGGVISEPAIGDTIQAHLPGWHGPFGSKQEALDYYNANKAANPGWAAPSGLLGGIGNTVAAGAGAAAKAVVGTGWNLTLGNTSGLLTRILKVGMGLILIIAGALKISGAGKTLGQVLPVVGGPAGRLLKA